MTSFVSADFSHTRYSSFRPTYPSALYETILSYHTGQRDTALDLGTGHALVARELNTHFNTVHASDPSPGMLAQARELTTTNAPNTDITFHESPAENSPFVGDASVDLVTAAQAAHWFDYARLWPELARVVRSGGSVAFWGYKDPVLVGYPQATDILNHYAYALEPEFMGSYWQQPGRSIVQDKLRAVCPPAPEWIDVQRIEYEPATGEGTRFMRASMRLGDLGEYVRTWSAFHGWSAAWPRRKRVDEGGEGDVVDEMLKGMREVVPEFRGVGGDGEGWKDVVVELEWGTGLVLARRA